MASTPGQSLLEECQRLAQLITEKEEELEGLRTNKEDPEQQAYLRCSIRQLRDKEQQLREERLLLLRQAATNAGPPLMTTRALLRLPLPEASTSQALTTTSSQSDRICHEYQPTAVHRWEHVDVPGMAAEQPLVEAIMGFQDAAEDSIARCRVFPMQPLEVPLDSEAAVASAWQFYAAERLTELAKQAVSVSAAPTPAPAATPPSAAATSISWMQQPPSQIVLEAVAYRAEQHKQQVQHLPDASITAVQRTRSGREVFSPRSDVMEPTSQPSGSKKRKMDFVLTVGQPSVQQQQPLLQDPAAAAQAAPITRPAASPAQASTSAPPTKPTKRRSICVGEVKVFQKLSVDGEPLDLVQLWGSPAGTSSTVHNTVRAVIAQLYTYMILWKLSFGFLTCWFWTWIVYCPPDNRTQLYISSPVAASSSHAPPQRPAVTVMGALAWLQHRAMDSMTVAVDDHPGVLESFPSCSSSDDDEPDAGALPGSQEDWRPDVQASSSRRNSASGSKQGPGAQLPGGKRHKQQQLQQQDPTASCALQLHSQLCQGSSGLVYDGTYAGSAAVVKLYGPDSDALSTYANELHMYSAMAAVQGNLLPVLLGAGHLAAGVHCIATKLVDGIPLSRMPTIPVAVGAAAVQALQQLQQAVPGFLHGDIRLPNILLCHDTALSDTAAQCVFVDLGWSRLGGTAAEMQHEIKQLKRLVAL